MIYTLCKKTIESGNYEYGSMLNKLDVYLLGNRISVPQYNELKDMMDAQQSA
jgi:hypothetical protein